MGQRASPVLTNSPPGVFSFSQAGLDAATHISFHNNPVPINLMLTGLTLLIGLGLTSFVFVKGRQVTLEHAREDAEGVTQGLLGGDAALDTLVEDEVLET